MQRTNVPSTSDEPTIVILHRALTDGEGEATGELNERFPASLLTAEKLEVEASPLRLMAARTGSRVLEIDSPHAARVAHPQAVTDLIAEATAVARPIPSTVTDRSDL